MQSKIVAERRTLTATLCAAVAAHAEEVAAALAKKLSPDIAPAESTSFVLAVLKRTGRRVAWRCEQLLGCQNDLAIARSVIAEVRQRRDRAVAAMGRRLAQLRDLSSAFGCPSLFGRGRVGQQPKALLEQADAVLSRLREQPLEPSAARGFVRVDVATLTTDLERAAGELRSALDELERWELKVDVAVANRRWAVSVFDTTYATEVPFAEQVFILAGRRRLARRLRPRKRRHRRASGGADDEQPAETPAGTQVAGNSGEMES